MFQAHVNKNHVASAANLIELIYHGTVRQLRKTHGNALIGLLTNMMQAMILVAVFFIMFSILGLRTTAVRGDFLLYVMSGIFLFLTHTKAMGAVVGTEGPASPIMQHAPMNTVIAIWSAALAALYIQVLSLAVILIIYYTVITNFVVQDPVGAIAMLLLAWLSGIGVGLVFLALKPWFPGFVGIASTIYARANMIASGKFFLANTLPPKMLALFSWNPLFHTIDQARGFTFINYNPHNTSVIYPVVLTLALIMIGLMGEFFTRKHASASWNAML
ncbi:MAG: ABC transporter permease [Halocynthiibacter sp.]